MEFKREIYNIVVECWKQYSKDLQNLDRKEYWDTILEPYIEIENKYKGTQFQKFAEDTLLAYTRELDLMWRMTYCERFYGANNAAEKAVRKTI